MNTLLQGVVERLVRTGNLKVTAPDGTVETFGDGSGASVHVVVKSHQAQRAILLDPTLAFPEAYMNGEIDFVEVAAPATDREIAAATPRHPLTTARTPRSLFVVPPLLGSRRLSSALPGPTRAAYSKPGWPRWKATCDRMRLAAGGYMSRGNGHASRR